MQVDTEKPKKSRCLVKCLAMKELDLVQMENIQGGMPCAIALGLYAAAFIGAAAATGGMAVIGLISMGGAVWSVIDSCKYKL